MPSSKPKSSARLALAGALAIAGVGAGGWAIWSSVAPGRTVTRPVSPRRADSDGRGAGAPQRSAAVGEGPAAAGRALETVSSPPVSHDFPAVAEAADVGVMMQGLADKVYQQASEGAPAEARKAASHPGLADTVRIFLEPAVAGDSAGFTAAVERLRGTPPDAPEGRPLGPASALLTLASLDYSNLSIRIPGPDDAPMFGTPKDKPAGEKPRLPVAMLRRAEASPGGGGEVETASMVIPLFEIFPDVADFRKRGMDAVSVRLPGRIKGSSGGADFDLSLIMVWNGGDSRWQPGLLMLDTKNTDLFKTVMAEARARRSQQEDKK